MNHHRLLHPLPQNPSAPDLTASLSTLKELISLTEQTLNSLENSNIKSDGSTLSLVSCPHNPNHLVPPEALFRHTLACPSTLDISHIVQSLNYPHSLTKFQKSKQSIPKLSNLETPLCFSLDGYVDFRYNFYYDNCPGVVNLGSLNDALGANKVFTLPSALFKECEEDEDSVITSSGSVSLEFFKQVLASELWRVRDELDSWYDFPKSCSLTVLKCLLCVVADCDLKNWIIVNSPRFGIVIDVHMRDHMFLLLRLCLRAIAREAFRLLILVTEEKEKNSEMNLMSRRFECLGMNEVLGWLAAQLSILYGDVNGKLFAMEMFKHSVISSGLCSLLFPLEKKEGVVQSNDERRVLKRAENSVCCVRDGKTIEMNETDVENEMPEAQNGGVIFVCQVAAAVAALHERSLFEEIIRGLRHPQPTAKHFILAEHTFLTKKAEEERQKRKKYRGILEHDGLLLQQSRGQETNKSKTREELLAEERDYKRRRMSYRGKKLKRTKIEVTRDIINEYMEEIKQAGGIGCFVKGTDNQNLPFYGPYSGQESSSDANEIQLGMHSSSRAGRRNIEGYEESHFSDKSRSLNQFSSADMDKKERDICSYEEQLSDDPKRVHGIRYESEYRSSHRSRGRSYGDREEQSRHQKKLSTSELSKTEHHESGVMFTGISSDHASRSHSGSDPSVLKDNQRLRYKERRQKNTDRYHHRSYSLSRDTFDDRYDPSQSHDIENNNT